MDSRQLVAFHAVSQTRSITRAAADLGYSQSAVTSQIKSLEAIVQVPLFDRRRDGVRLTGSGERFLPYVTRLLKLMDDARTALAPDSALAGKLTIGAGESITTYRLPEVVECFHHTHPDVQLSLRLFHEGSEEIQRSLVSGDIDVALVHAVEPGARGLRSAKLNAEEVVLIAAPDHPLASRAVVTVEDLYRSRILIAQRGCVYEAALQTELAEFGPNAIPPLQFGTVEGVKKAVVTGFGVTLLARVAVQDLIDSGAVVVLPWTPSAIVSTYVIWDEKQCEERLLRPLLSVLEQVAVEWSTSSPQRGLDFLAAG